MIDRVGHEWPTSVDSVGRGEPCCAPRTFRTEETQLPKSGGCEVSDGTSGK
jgi:hypothetical protein